MKKKIAAPHDKKARMGNPPPQAAQPLKWLHAPAFHLALIALIGLLAYSNTFHVPFILDDESSISNNPVIKDLASFLDGAGYRYNSRRFIGYLTIALNYRRGGLNVTGYHIFNLAVHIASAWLVYFLLGLTLRTPFFAMRSAECGVRDTEFKGFYTPNSEFRIPNSLVPLFAALLFVAHPIQTQAVTYIIQRLASLAAMFYLASLVCYIQARLRQEATGRLLDSRACLWYLFSLVAAVLAMKTKEIAFTLPLIVGIYEFSFFGASAKKKLLFLLPLALTIIIVPISLIHAGKPLGDLLSDLSEMTRETKTISRGGYLLTQFSVIVTYLRLLILPINQNLDYDYPVFHSLFTPRVLFSFLLLCSLLALAAWLYYQCKVQSAKCKVQNGNESKVQSAKCKVQNGDGKNSFALFDLHFALCTPAAMRLIAFGILWFFVTLSVESSIVPITDVIFEHRMYLPSVGIFIAVAAAAALALKSSAKSYAAVAVGCACILAGAAWARNSVWGDKINLWSDVVAKSPMKARPHYNLGTSYSDVNRIDDAIEQFQTAVRINPDYEKAHANIGAAYVTKGLTDQAIEHLTTALRLHLDDMKTHYNLGLAYGQKGLIDKSIEQYLLAIARNPDYEDAHYNLALAYAGSKRFDDAIGEFKAALRLAPDDSQAHNDIGLIYVQIGQLQSAVENFQIAYALNPQKAEYRENLARASSMFPR